MAAAGSVDLLVIGGGIHGAAVARDAAGRGMKVMLAEKGDYASATSSASSKLIHGGLRYLEHLELALVRESLLERAELLRTAPHLVVPQRFLLPVYDWQNRQAWLIQTGLALYDLLSRGDGLPASGRLSQRETALLQHLRQDELAAVLHYHDAKTDDARLTLAVLLDARKRGADILNRRAVTAISPVENGYAVELDERGTKIGVIARFVVNASGPWVARIDAMTAGSPPPRPLRLVRGSHIVLPMPEPPLADAYTLQDEDERIVFVIPWLDGHFLIVGTTDMPHEGDPAEAVCSAEEEAYLLAAYNRYFSLPSRAATSRDIVFTWSGVRALHDDEAVSPSRISRNAALSSIANGSGGFVTLYGGKLTTHRLMAGQVLDRLARLGAKMGGPWNKGTALFGGSLSRAELLSLAEHGPAKLAYPTRRRLVFTYGDQARGLFARMEDDPSAAREIAPGVTRAELEHAVEAEDAMTAEDFLLRRTKLALTLRADERDAVERWFIASGL
ncbi:glycerol-3-phosphate dehydrogenase [Methyloceanibacter sp.]|uniref:glycerol-3-phosphate dehydrogenase n=1 Tax=Methyloceanibacter sp. TaxID=1965321 RepID=UPI002D49434D|nr:glycerol-3-phosphate dehydrogenase [Methyloceanibacter sp.]HZP10254.1 glycerol-3-phosphate dehydrogenase [Methyloceanibacter sp.]